MNWDSYLATRTTNGRHNDHPLWRTCFAAWEFIRDDGLHTAHPMEWPSGGPGSKRAAVEGSMELADKYIPLGAKLPKGMRSREDPLYNPLLDLEESEDPLPADLE